MDYPEWQKTIREIQSRAKEIEAIKEREREIDRQNSLYEQGHKLKCVLALFGIDAQPEQGEFVLGDYIFSLPANQNPNFDITKKDDGTLKSATFMMLVKRVHPTDDYNWDNLYSWISTNGWMDGTRFNKVVCDLASTFDILESNYQEHLKKHEIWLRKQSETTSVEEVRPTTLAERIEQLIRDIAEEVVEERF